MSGSPRPGDPATGTAARAARLARLRLGTALALRRAGALPWIVVAALLGAVGLQAWTLQMQQARARLLAEVARTEALAGRAPAAAARVDPLQAFREVLAPPDERAALGRALWEAAGREGLQVSHVEFSDAADAGGLFVRSELRVPVDGPEPQVRRFAWALLAAHPGLALQRMEWRRDAAGPGTLHAQLWFTLFVRPGAAS